MTTLKEQMTADVAGVFLNTDEFATTWTWVPQGVVANQQQIKVVDVWDQMEGTREVAGDGRALHKPDGTIIRNSVTLEMAATISISEPKGTGQTADRFVDPDGVVYVVKRVIGRDEHMQSVLVVRAQSETRRQGGQRG